MEATIIRRPTEKDKTFTGDDGKVNTWLVGGQKNDRELFIEELGKQRLKVGKDKEGIILPFADKPALDDYDEYEEKKIQTVKRTGYLPDSFKELKLDWSKYSDPDNFELIEEKEVPDTNLSNKNPGLNVVTKTKVYKYLDYQNIYTCQEDSGNAIIRATKARMKLEEDLKKSK